MDLFFNISYNIDSIRYRHVYLFLIFQSKEILLITTKLKDINDTIHRVIRMVSCKFKRKSCARYIRSFISISCIRTVI